LLGENVHRRIRNGDAVQVALAECANERGVDGSSRVVAKKRPFGLLRASGLAGPMRWRPTEWNAASRFGRRVDTPYIDSKFEKAVATRARFLRL